MNDIVLSKEILLENGFHETPNKFFDQVTVSEFGDDVKTIFELSVNSERQGTFFLDIRLGLSNFIDRDWYIHIDNDCRESVASADIHTIGHFNMLMELMDIPFKMKTKIKDEQETSSRS